MSSVRLRVAVASATGALALALLAGCAGVTGTPPGPMGAATGIPESPFSAGGLQDPRSAAAPGRGDSQATPTRVRIPSIGVNSALEELEVGADGSLDAPISYDLAGWYAGGVAPGAIGPAIIAGHVDSPTAPAVFARLGELAPGAEILVTMSDGSELAFDVTGSTQSAKSNFPTADVYGNLPTPELRLITCTGRFDPAAGHYTDNLIVFAVLRA